jgi:hypothetical protein
LLQAGLTVDIVNPANNLRRGSITIDYNFNFLGSTNTFGFTGADTVHGFQQELMQILRDLNLADSVTIETK